MHYQKYALPTVLILCALVIFLLIRPLLTAIILAAIIAYVLHPVYKKATRILKIQWISALLVVGVSISLLVTSVYFAANALSTEAFTLYISGKQLFSQGFFFDTCDDIVCQKVQGVLDDVSIRSYLSNLLEGASEFMLNLGSQFLLSLPLIIANVVIIVFLVYYMIQQGGQFVENLLALLGVKKDHSDTLKARFGSVVFAVIYGNLFIAFLQGFLATLGFMATGTTSPIFWGLITILCALSIGTGWVWGPAAILLIMEGSSTGEFDILLKGILLFLYGLLVISTIDNFLKPKLIGEHGGIHPALVILGIFGGIFLFGPTGAIIGPLLLSMALAFLNMYVTPQQNLLEAEPSEK